MSPSEDTACPKKAVNSARQAFWAKSFRFSGFKINARRQNCPVETSLIGVKMPSGLQIFGCKKMTFIIDTGDIYGDIP